MSLSNISPIFILRRNAFRERSLLLDVFSREAGKFSCIAKLNKSQHLRYNAILAPFRLLDAQWFGKGDLFTLKHVEERQRFPLQHANLVRAVYLNEVLMKCLWSHHIQASLFDAYSRTLARLVENDECAMPMFELMVLAMLGYELNLYTDDATGQDIHAQMRYRFIPDQGLVPATLQSIGVPISGALLIGLRQPEILAQHLHAELRLVIDNLLQMVLKGKPLYARQLLNE